MEAFPLPDFALLAGGILGSGSLVGTGVGETGGTLKVSSLGADGGGAESEELAGFSKTFKSHNISKEKKTRRIKIKKNAIS